MTTLKDVWRARLAALWKVVLAPFGLRTLVLGGLGLWLLSHDWAAAKSFAFGLGLVCVALAVIQWFRKVAMPYLDQRVLVEKAVKDPMAAAIVYAATRAFDVAILMFLLFTAIRP